MSRSGSFAAFDKGLPQGESHSERRPPGGLPASRALIRALFEALRVTYLVAGLITVATADQTKVGVSAIIVGMMTGMLPIRIDALFCGTQALILGYEQIGLTL